MSTTVHVYVVPDGIIVVGALFVGAVVNAVPLQIVAVWFGTTGLGLMVIVNVDVDPTHATALLVYVGVTVTVATTGILVTFVPVNDVMFPVPDAPSPIDVVLLAHVYTVDATLPVMVTPLTVDPAHTT